MAKTDENRPGFSFASPQIGVTTSGHLFPAEDAEQWEQTLGALDRMGGNVGVFFPDQR